MFVNSQRSWLVKELNGHIDRRFGVKLTLANEADNQEMLSKTKQLNDNAGPEQMQPQQNQWIDMTGDPINITRVKSYIEMVINPEEAVTVYFPDQMEALLNNERMITALETMADVAIMFPKRKGYMHVFANKYEQTATTFKNIQSLIYKFYKENPNDDFENEHVYQEEMNTKEILAASKSSRPILTESGDMDPLTMEISQRLDKSICSDVSNYNYSSCNYEIKQTILGWLTNTENIDESCYIMKDNLDNTGKPSIIMIDSDDNPIEENTVVNIEYNPDTETEDQHKSYATESIISLPSTFHVEDISSDAPSTPPIPISDDECTLVRDADVIDDTQEHAIPKKLRELSRLSYLNTSQKSSSPKDINFTCQGNAPANMTNKRKLLRTPKQSTTASRTVTLSSDSTPSQQGDPPSVADARSPHTKFIRCAATPMKEKIISGFPKKSFNDTMFDSTIGNLNSPVMSSTPCIRRKISPPPTIVLTDASDDSSSSVSSNDITIIAAPKKFSVDQVDSNKKSKNKHRYSIQAPQVSKNRLANILAKNLLISSKEANSSAVSSNKKSMLLESMSSNTTPTKTHGQTDIPTIGSTTATGQPMLNSPSSVHDVTLMNLPAKMPAIVSDLPTPKCVRDIPLPPMDPLANRGPNCKKFTKISSNKDLDETYKKILEEKKSELKKNAPKMKHFVLPTSKPIMMVTDSSVIDLTEDSLISSSPSSSRILESNNTSTSDLYNNNKKNRKKKRQRKKSTSSCTPTPQNQASNENTNSENAKAETAKSGQVEGKTRHVNFHQFQRNKMESERRTAQDRAESKLKQREHRQHKHAAQAPTLTQNNQPAYQHQPTPTRSQIRSDVAQVHENNARILSRNAGAPAPPSNTNGLKYIVIDGSNVAMAHGNNKVFSCKGIQIVVDYFLARGHTEITSFVPEWRISANSTKQNPITDIHILHKLKENNHLVLTPSKKMYSSGRTYTCYDDRFHLKLAHLTNGIVVSNDKFKDLFYQNYDWRDIIDNRLLKFSFVSDFFMVPDDPCGKFGPHLDEFLVHQQYPLRATSYFRTNPDYFNYKNYYR